MGRQLDACSTSRYSVSVLTLSLYQFYVGSIADPKSAAQFPVFIQGSDNFGDLHNFSYLSKMLVSVRSCLVVFHYISGSDYFFLSEI